MPEVMAGRRIQGRGIADQSPTSVERYNAETNRLRALVDVARLGEELIVSGRVDDSVKAARGVRLACEAIDGIRAIIGAKGGES